ncbi:MAG: protein kinase family protein, partial [Planctomycetota bacterium]
MYCPECGQENVDSARFCVGCGANVAELTPRPTSKPGVTPAPSRDDWLEAAHTILAEQVRPGELLAGQYRVLDSEPIGTGGMGEVWRAEDAELGVTVAVKVLPPALARDKAALEALRREALIGRQLTHRHICR